MPIRNCFMGAFIIPAQSFATHPNFAFVIFTNRVTDLLRQGQALSFGVIRMRKSFPLALEAIQAMAPQPDNSFSIFVDRRHTSSGNGRGIGGIVPVMDNFSRATVATIHAGVIRAINKSPSRSSQIDFGKSKLRLLRLSGSCR